MGSCSNRADEISRESDMEREWQDIEKLLDNLYVTDTLRKHCNDIDKNIVLFGAGIYGEIALSYFRENRFNVICFCDNDIGKQGKSIGGIPVISPKELASMDNTFVIITARHNVKEISGQLSRMDIEHISFDAYFVMTMKDRYKKVYFDMFYESRSAEIFTAILKSMISGSKSYCSAVMEDNAFFALPQFKNTGNEIFVDAGAYVGDTVEQFIWNNIGAFRKIYAFEPGERQYKAMQVRINRLVEEWAIDREKIICIKGGLGERNDVLPFSYSNTSPTSSNFISSNDPQPFSVNIYSLDSILGNEAVTMIKADVEGFEMEMLKGAESIIKRCHPKLAISIYHKPQDLYEIPAYIKSLVPEYRMALRHHACNLVETVLYCWVE